MISKNSCQNPTPTLALYLKVLLKANLNTAQLKLNKNKT
jgi:hypothetical protein